MCAKISLRQSFNDTSEGCFIFKKQERATLKFSTYSNLDFSIKMYLRGYGKRSKLAYRNNKTNVPIKMNLLQGKCFQEGLQLQF